MANKGWFEVDKNGLREIQAGKPYSYIVRELIQNAFDEDGVTEVQVKFESKNNRTVIISCQDNSPTGFRDIKDAYTLYGSCYKRSDPSKRGRFDVGEKQAMCLASKATIETTCGSVTFDDNGRKFSSRNKLVVGTRVTLEVPMKRSDMDEMWDFCHLIIPPKNIKLWVNCVLVHCQSPIKEFKTILATEYLKDGIMAKTKRETKVKLYSTSSAGARLYEMGIPVCPIECQYSIEVDQRIPLGVDRDTVSQSYLRDLFSEVLNNTYDQLTPANVSETWVREGMSDERASKEAVKTVLTTRYGDDFCSASPNDPRATDEAISKGFKVITGAEMSGEEWGQVKKHELIESSHELFGFQPGESKPVAMTDNMKLVKLYVEMIAQETMGINATATFIDLPGGCAGYYQNRVVQFNVTKLPKSFFDKPLSIEVLDLILHELAHEYGHHTQDSYHQALSSMGAKLILLVLENPKFFEVNVEDIS